MAKLIVTNGDSAAANMRAAGIKGHLLEWRDMLHDGPVPADESLEVVSDARAGFLSEALGLEFGAVRADFAQRDGEIESHIAYRDVEMWFEHDLYDQLQLIQLLAFFAREPERLGLSLVQARTYLGTMGAPGIAALAPSAAPVTTVQLEAGREAWEAFTADTPIALAALSETSIGSLPYLSAALRRGLCEFPAPESGLSLTQERALGALAEGPQAAGRLFGLVTAQDEAQFLGDLAFFLRLDELAFAGEPLIAGLPFPARTCGSFTPCEPPTAAEETYRAYARAEVTITSAGLAALKGGFDHAAANGIDRWFGGTHIRPDALWRYDRRARRLIRPA